MKVLFSLIIAIVVYLICGLIAWNIVYSIIDNSNCTIAELANYKIYAYSGITVLFITIVELCRSYDRDDISHIFILIINTLIATSANEWENIWESTGKIHLLPVLRLLPLPMHLNFLRFF